jgi:hypothetical protein
MYFLAMYVQLTANVCNKAEFREDWGGSPPEGEIYQ